jgi:hypothetical protein
MTIRHSEHCLRYAQIANRAIVTVSRHGISIQENAADDSRLFLESQKHQPTFDDSAYQLVFLNIYLGHSTRSRLQPAGDTVGLIASQSICWTMAGDHFRRAPVVDCRRIQDVFFLSASFCHRAGPAPSVHSNEMNALLPAFHSHPVMQIRTWHVARHDQGMCVNERTALEHWFGVRNHTRPSC